MVRYFVTDGDVGIILDMVHLVVFPFSVTTGGVLREQLVELLVGGH